MFSQQWRKEINVALNWKLSQGNHYTGGRCITACAVVNQLLISCFEKHGVYFLFFQQPSLELIDNCKGSSAPSPCLEFSLVKLKSFSFMYVSLMFAGTTKHHAQRQNFKKQLINYYLLYISTSVWVQHTPNSGQNLLCVFHIFSQRFDAKMKKN